jgi:hypothetical protein
MLGRRVRHTEMRIKPRRMDDVGKCERPPGEGRALQELPVWRQVTNPNKRNHIQRSDSKSLRIKCQAG